MQTTWLPSMFEITYAYVCRDWFLCVTWRDLFICEHADDMTHLYVTWLIYDSFLLLLLLFLLFTGTASERTHLETVTLCSTDHTRIAAPDSVLPTVTRFLVQSPFFHLVCLLLVEILHVHSFGLLLLLLFLFQIEEPLLLWLFVYPLFLWCWFMSVLLMAMPALLLLVLLMLMDLAYVWLNIAQWGVPRI